MKATSTLLASGTGWLVRDIICTAGPHDRPFEEQHDAAYIAVVTEGTFQYRSTQGDAVLGPGAMLLGNQGECFQCGHDHGVGDRCLSFRFTADHLEAIVAEVPGARQATFAVSHLPPLLPLMPLIAAAEVARDASCSEELEELALTLAAAVASTVAGSTRASSRPSRRDGQRVTEALRRIEADAHEPLSLADLARDAGMSPYHFLRTFRRLVGMTPYQFVLRTRLHRAAVRLRRSDEAISSIAFDVGFSDLSTFNHRFRRVMGASPSAYRAAKLVPGRRNAAG